MQLAQQQTTTKPENTTPGNGSAPVSDKLLAAIQAATTNTALLDAALLGSIEKARAQLTPAHCTALEALFAVATPAQQDQLFKAIGSPWGVRPRVVEKSVVNYGLDAKELAKPEYKDAYKDGALLVSTILEAVEKADPGAEVFADAAGTRPLSGTSLNVRTTFYVRSPALASDQEYRLVFGQLLRLPAAVRLNAAAVVQSLRGSSSSTYRPESQRLSLTSVDRYAETLGTRWDDKRRDEIIKNHLDQHVPVTQEALEKDPNAGNPALRLTRMTAAQRAELEKVLGAPLTAAELAERTEATKTAAAEARFAQGATHEIGHAMDFRDHPGKAVGSGWHVKAGWKFADTAAKIGEVAGFDPFASTAVKVPTVKDTKAGTKATTPTNPLSEADLKEHAEKVYANHFKAGATIASATAGAASAIEDPAQRAQFTKWFEGTTLYRMGFVAPATVRDWSRRLKVGGGTAFFGAEMKTFFHCDSGLTSNLESLGSGNSAFSPREWAADGYAAYFTVKNPGDAPGKSAEAAKLHPLAKAWLDTVAAEKVKPPPPPSKN